MFAAVPGIRAPRGPGRGTSHIRDVPVKPKDFTKQRMLFSIPVALR